MLKQTGKRPAQLDGPEFPEGLEYLWEWFWDVFTGTHLTYTELAAWAQLKRIKLTKDEVTIIRHLDRTYWRVQAEGVNKR